MKTSRFCTLVSRRQPDLLAVCVVGLLTALSLHAQPIMVDHGDAPDPTYPTLIASGGAQHAIQPGWFLGTLIDAENDGQPHPFALGDDLANFDDDDGVLFLPPSLMGQTVQVTASTAGFLNAWIDFGVDGSWAQPGDQIFIAQPLMPGVNVLSFALPMGFVPGVPTFARFRFSSVPQLGYTGAAPDGEVEDYAVIITEEEGGLDFGDAPDPTYPTLLASGGANHQIVPGFYLGWLIDAERDGQPNANATGDDLAKLPDEDGVSFLNPLSPGATVQVQVVASTAGFLNAWLDFGADGTWNLPMDLIFAGTPLVAGTNLLSFTVPAGATVGLPTFARFRFSSQQFLPFTGHAPDGEVEDYQVIIQQQLGADFGDAPDQPYPTLLASNGARHTIVPGMFMGALIDNEADGQPHLQALGDDLANLADEDGVVFMTPLIQGQIATVVVTVSQPGMLNAWIDFGADGSWAQPIDQIFNNQALAAGANTLNFGVPINASMGLTFARFRYNSTGNLTYTGSATDGEVEDYQVFIEEPLNPTDFGDAPDPTYPTYFTNNGAFHYIAPGVQLGAQIDSETDGQPNANATGDDTNNIADEDGVTFLTPLVSGQIANVRVVASTNGNLDAWIDYGADGSWAQLGDQVFASQPLVTGTNGLTFTVPATAVAGNTFARFRFSTLGGFTFTGPAQDGEVEDYEVKIQPVQQTRDYGDAPDQPYPTLLASNGARHTILPGMFLGALIDAEPNGQPNATATGDDLAGLADEDGVQFVGWLIPGWPATINVTASTPGLLDAWVDFGVDGSWAQAIDQIFTSRPLVAGTNTLSFIVPPTANWGRSSFARFRFSSSGGLSFTGLASDGEVEDYRVVIEQPPQHDLGDAPDSTSNHPGAPMTAYPAGGPAGVIANFPTTLSITSPPPYGPIHHLPKAIAHLGPGVSLEWEADVAADEDMINNILPLTDQPDLDQRDDGVLFPLALPQCAPTKLQYVVNVTAATNMVLFLNVWFDWNRDGDWNDATNCPNGLIANEWAVQNDPVNLAVPLPVPFLMTNLTSQFVAWHPAGAKQPIWMRVTLSEQLWPPPGGTIPAGGEGPFNGYNFGETEDYYITDYEAEEAFDWGDAPDPTYPTRAASGGAQHLIIPSFCLGVAEDAEADGQPDAAATGDDTNNVADEDGIVFTTPLLLATQACVNVVLQSGAAGGLLDAWVDFNSDGAWGAGDQIFTSQPLAAGLNSGLCFAVPATGKLGPTFARFRLSSVGGLTPSGAAPDGEVEDYLVVLKQFRPLTNIVITNIAVTNVMVGTNAGQAVTLWWTTQTNLHCQVEAVTNLTGAPTNLHWFNIGGEVIGPANTQTETNVPTTSERYYRVRAPFTWP
jgi:hypothetical protein